MKLSNLMSKKTPSVPEPDDKGHEMMEIGLKCEAEEHPWLTAAQVKHLVNDHLSKDPGYYKDEKDEHADVD